MATESEGYSITIPFDNAAFGAEPGRYEFEIFPEDAEALRDGVVLALDRAACLSFAEVFRTLAEGGYPDGYHVHRGWTEECNPGGVGVRIQLSDDGRIAP